MAEIVKVVREGGKGYHFINKQDFDPSKHVLFEQEDKPAPKVTKKAEQDK